MKRDVKHRRLFTTLLLALAVVVMCLPAFAKQALAEVGSLNVSAQPPEAGKTAFEVNDGVYTFTANANEGYVFDRWTIGESEETRSSETPWSVSAESLVDVQSVVAHFKLIQTITAEDVTGIAGNTGKIDATTSGDGALSYKLAEGSEEFVTVTDDGTLSFLKEGTAKVIITAEATQTYAAAQKEVTVTVNARTVDPVAVTSVTLDPTKASLTVGESKTLTATVKPDNATDKSVAWSSSNESVATVTDGKVTAKAVGTATITATSNADKTKKATCEVTVERKAPAKITYECTSGADSTFVKGTGAQLTLIFKRTEEDVQKDTAYQHFRSATVDDTILTKDKDYTVKEGSAIVTLNAAYLDALGTGTHTLAATFDDGSAEAEFAVADPTVTITFDANEGTGTMEPVTVTKGTSITLKKNTFKRTGYFFTGWNLAADGSGQGYTDEESVVASFSGTLYAQWTPYPAPTMSNSRGGSFTSTSQEITYTVEQEVPIYATSLRTWVDLEDVQHFTSDTMQVETSAGVASPNFEDGRLTVTVDNATSLRGQTLVITYHAALDDGADLGPYMNSAGNTASVPYQAHTVFNGDDEGVVHSTTEYVKYRVSNSSSSSGSSTSYTTRAASTSAKAEPLAKTGDPTTLVGVLVTAAAGSAAMCVGARRRR